MNIAAQPVIAPRPSPLCITPARSGGYIVSEPSTQPGFPTQSVFAGSLQDCLDYALRHFMAGPGR